MYHSQNNSDDQLPSTAQLVKSTLLALMGAGVLLVCVVMPAEYGIDPTGFGKLTGLQQMGEIRKGLEAEAVKDEARKPELAEIGDEKADAGKAEEPAEIATAEDAAAGAILSDEMVIALAPQESQEIKVMLSKGKAVSYEWRTDGARIFFDMHGDSSALAIDYHKYEKGASDQQTGDLVAAFDGKHGWYWKNLTPGPVTITLKTKGPYSKIEKLK